MTNLLTIKQTSDLYAAEKNLRELRYEIGL
jgi:hypothetical protein